MEENVEKNNETNFILHEKCKKKCLEKLKDPGYLFVTAKVDPSS